MNRASRTGLEIFILVVLFVVLGIASYYSGSNLGKSLIAGTAISYSQWQSSFQKLVGTTGAVAGILTLCWYLLARFVLTVRNANDGGKRPIWLFIGLLTAIASFLIPFAYAANDSTLKIGPGIYALFFVLFTLVGYWGGSLLATPAPYKYTPFLAAALRAPKNRK